MVGILTYLQYGLGKAFYPIRAHDSGQIAHCRALKSSPLANMTLESIDCGSSGSPMLAKHTCLDKNGDGQFPNFRWTPPPSGDVKEYVLICEDIDLPIPFLVIHHGLYFNIPPSTTSASHVDIEEMKGNDKAHTTNAGWIYVPNIKGSSYIGPAPPLGHGAHRYVFTIIALDQPLGITSQDRVTKQQVKEAMVDKVIGWGQWTGVFQRPWPK